MLQPRWPLPITRSSTTVLARATATWSSAAGVTPCRPFWPQRGRAIAAALKREGLRKGDWIPAGTAEPAICAAIHTGRLARPAEGHLGSPALRVVRLCAMAEPGQILVSHATQALLEGRIFDQLSLRDLG